MAEEFPGVISLNVGGRLFTTHLSTLTKEPDSMLAAMFSGRHPVSKDQDGRYFIDADGDTFAHILNYLRFGTLPPATVALSVYEYSRYFGIKALQDLVSQYGDVVRHIYCEKIRSMYPQFNEILNSISQTVQDKLFEYPMYRINSYSDLSHSTDVISLDIVLKNLVDYPIDTNSLCIQTPEQDFQGHHLVPLLAMELDKRGYPAMSIVRSSDKSIRIYFYTQLLFEQRKKC